MALDLAFWLSLFGLIVAGMAILKITFGYQRKHVAFLAGLLILGALVMGGGLLSPILAAVSPPPAAPVAEEAAIWSIAFNGGASPAAFPIAGTVLETVIVSTSGLTADVYMVITAGMATMTSGVATFDVVNLNTAGSFQLKGLVPTFSSVADAATGGNFPLVLPSASNPALPNVVYASGSGDGAMVQGVWYQTFSPDAATPTTTDTLTATTALNGAGAGAAMVVGQVYSITYVIGGISLVVNFHPTGA